MEHAGAFVEQTVTMPPGFSGPDTKGVLEFMLRIAGTETGMMRVLVDGTQVWPTGSFNPGLYGEYKNVSIPLNGLIATPPPGSPPVSGTHTIRFETSNYGPVSDPKKFFVDDVALRTMNYNGTYFTFSCSPNWGIDAAPGFLYFGVVPAGYVDRQIAVRNTGTTLLNGEASVDPPYSIVGESLYDLWPGESKTLTVRFTPEAAGSYAQRLSLTGGGGFAVPLYGYTEEGDDSGTGDVILTEVQNNNWTTLRDGDGDFSDWIELANYSDYPIDLQGWTLEHTRNGGTMSSWTFPSVIIPAGDFLVVFASGNTGATIDAGLHTSFTLDNTPTPTGGGALVLRRNATAGNAPTAQSPQYPFMFADWSYNYIPPLDRWGIATMASAMSHVGLSSLLSTFYEFRKLTFEKANRQDMILWQMDPAEPDANIDEYLVGAWLDDGEHRLYTRRSGVLSGSPDVQCNCFTDIEFQDEGTGPWAKPIPPSHPNYNPVVRTLGEVFVRAQNMTEDVLILGFTDMSDGSANLEGMTVINILESTMYPVVQPGHEWRRIVLFVQLDYSPALTLVHELGHFVGMYGLPYDPTTPFLDLKHHPTGARVLRIMVRKPDLTADMVTLGDCSMYLGRWKYPGLTSTDGFGGQPYNYDK